MRETKFLEYRPEPDWEFCLIEVMELERVEAGLEGSYVSEACEDRAHFVLERVGPVSASGTQPDEPPAPEQAEQAEPPAPERAEPEQPKQAEPSSCACSSGGGARGSAGLALLVLWAVSGLARRKARGG
jgi:hypothetical protein